MRLRQSGFAKILIFVMTLVLIAVNSYALTLDDKLLDKVFDKMNSLDPELREEAFNFIEPYLESPEKLDLLKKDLRAIMLLVIGDDYEEKLLNAGISLDELYDEIDALKEWTREDRLLLLEYAKKRDKAGILELYEKYESGSDKSDSGQGPGSEGSQNEQVQQEEKVTFGDINGHWAQKYIEEMAAKGIVKGVTSGLFAPEKNVTRAEFTTMLVRLLDLEKAEVDLHFTDVKKGDWYYEYISTAYINGLAKGKGNTFEPEALITREEMVVLITRAAAMKNKSTYVTSAEVEELLSKFKDKDQISDWAKTESAVALKLNLVKGRGEGIFSPKAHATRAEAATIIYNLYFHINSD